jgi:drug/metabolite transporter (DMT)-like permease
MKQHTLLILITIFEALIGIWVNLIGESVPIWTVNFYRVFFAFLTVAIVVPFWRTIKFKKSEIKSNLFIGVFIAMQISVFNIAMSLAPVANVVIFWSINPFFVFLYSVFFLKEKIKKTHVWVFLFGLIGLIISEPFAGIDEHVLGNSIALFSGLVYATLVTLLRKNKADRPENVFWYLLFAAVILTPAVIINGFGNLWSSDQVSLFGNSYELPAILWVLGLGVISTGLVYIFMRLTLSKITASLYAIFDVIVSPVAAGIFAYSILSEEPSRQVIIGGIILVLAAFYLSLDMANKNPWQFLKKLIRQEKQDIKKESHLPK